MAITGIKKMRSSWIISALCLCVALMSPVIAYAQEEDGGSYSGVDPETEKGRSDGFHTNFVKCLQQNECGMCEKNPGHTNPWGYLGFYQMGVNYASEALCNNSGSFALYNKNQPWEVFRSTCRLSATGAALLGGTAGQPITMAQFNMFAYGSAGGKASMNVEAARHIQTQMLLKNSEAQWKRIQKNLGSCIGKNMNGVTMTKETMVAMAHLKGYGGLQKTCAGKTGVKDGNGTSTLSYASCLAGCMSNDGKKGKCSFVVPHICDKKKSGTTTETTEGTGSAGTSGTSGTSGASGTSGTSTGSGSDDGEWEEEFDKGP